MAEGRRNYAVPRPDPDILKAKEPRGDPKPVAKATLHNPGLRIIRLMQSTA
jgi:hypothetical protein